MNTAGVVATAPENDAALRASGFLLLMASVFTVSMGHGAVLPLLPFFLERLPGDTACCAVSWHTGMLTGVYMFALFVFAPLWGRLSDRGGKEAGNSAGAGWFHIGIDTVRIFPDTLAELSGPCLGRYVCRGRTARILGLCG